MGALLEKLPEHGPFYLEARRESFYVNTHPDHLEFEGRRPDGVHDDLDPEEFRIPRQHLRAFAACLHSIAMTARYDAWIEEEGAGEAWALPFVLAATETHLELNGAVVAYGAGVDWTPIQSVELLYRDVPWLTAEVRAAI